VANHTLRLYLAVVTLCVFFVLWAAIAARPWAAAATPQPAREDPRLTALDRWQQRLQHESRSVNRLVRARWARYERRLRERRAQIAAAERAHALQVAAAQAAAARAVAAGSSSPAGAAPAPTQVTTVVSSVSTTVPPTAPAASAPAPKVVTLPPQVQIVTLPASSAPVTSSSTSKP
jgi:hypothetical protein